MDTYTLTTLMPSSGSRNFFVTSYVTVPSGDSRMKKVGGGTAGPT